MYCDANGRPDPNGDYEMINGKKVLRDGRSASFGLNFRDGAPSKSSVFLRDNPTMFTDAERQLFDSDEGRSIIAYARHCHRLSTGHLGDRAPEFTDAQAAAAIKQTIAQREGSARKIAQMTADADALEQQAAQARKDMIARMNGWRN
jgi:cytochrome c553